MKMNMKPINTAHKKNQMVKCCHEIPTALVAQNIAKFS